MKKGLRILAGVCVLLSLGLVIAIIIAGLIGPIPGGLVAAFLFSCVLNIGMYLMLVFTKNRK